MSTLLEEFKKCKGRNQARMALKAHCEKLGIDYLDYELSEEESAAYFFKLPWSPYSRNDGKSRQRAGLDN